MPEELNEEVGLPANWTPIDSAPIIPGKTPPVYAARDIYQSGEIPPIIGLQPDLVRSGEHSPTIPTVRLMPVAPSGLAQINAAVQSVVGTPVPGPAGPEGAAGTPGSGSDGLVHGDPIWDVDSAYSWFRDDFVYQGSIPADIWYSLSPGAANLSGAPPHVGVWRTLSGSMTTTTSLPQAALVLCSEHTSTNGMIGSTPWLDYPGWKMVWIFQWAISNGATPTVSASTLSNARFYVGLLAPTKGQVDLTTARPTAGVWLRYDTDPTSPAISDATFHFEAVSNDILNATITNVQGTAVDTGITPVSGQWYRLEMTCQAAGVIEMSLNGSAPVSLTMPTYSKVCSSAQYSSSGGYGWVSSGLAEMPFSLGSLITVSGASHSGFNGTFPSMAESMATFAFNFVLAGTQGTVSETITISGFPALLPFIFYSGDTAGGANGILDIDFYSYVWNSGLATSPLILAATNPRWVTGS